ncbi:sulfite exporter TauE/SafE family protein [Blastopirellula sp. JC732]|uniref:Probable membrane transporter protein n=1 Tax=Blastopirellula sediminis TaxID=2894196 RepID=A0A9X1MS95_9BACT|nr:sulfite exporter TauE/SafE family protein [Blastopirellula sediminis]MCC9604855.1 sulfite exporter TauE/SafE family protein [Blastopirellula sediminis]MCC9631846.1 sulfite exporter TauE/SafE family protein [Blastopirellula sediminis]
MSAIALLYGAIVGLSLGLTGGGGAIFAVPLLVYGMGVSMYEAVGISLAAVGATSLIGFLTRWRHGDVEIRTGLLFAVAGMIGAPIGTLVAGRMSEALLLGLFAVLMLIIAVRLWQKAATPQVTCETGGDERQPTCRRDASGQLQLTSRCAMMLSFVGLVTGVLSGMFGVGGGFVIVPALIFFTNMSIHKAVGASLMVIAIVSVSGVTSHLLVGRSIEPVLTMLFIAGGVGGLFAGQAIGRRLSGPALQKGFAVAIVAVAMFVIAKTLMA